MWDELIDFFAGKFREMNAAEWKGEWFKLVSKLPERETGQAKQGRTLDSRRD